MSSVSRSTAAAEFAANFIYPSASGSAVSLLNFLRSGAARAPSTDAPRTEVLGSRISFLIRIKSRISRPPSKVSSALAASSSLSSFPPFM